MKPIRMKPETIARRSREHAAEAIARRASRRQRLAELVKRDGPDSIWAEMLADEAVN